MAQARASTGWLVAVIATVTVLAATGVWNPFPDIWAWIDKSRPLSDPGTAWQERLGGVPRSVSVLERFIVVEQRESVEVRTREGGRRLWETPADWATIAGPAEREVVISGKLLKKGYEVRDPASGRVLRKDEKASAVWSFANALIDVSCRTPKDCELTAREPASGDELWRAGLPGIGFVLFADNPKLAMGALLTQDRIEVRVEPPPMPRHLGFPIDGRLHLVDTTDGEVLPVIEPDRNTSVTVLGGRVVHSIATKREGGCQLTISGRDAATGSEVWRKDGYLLRTISGAGCEQRKEPVAGGNAVVAVRPDGREALLDAADGREVLTCAEGERILATNGIHAVVRSADDSKISGFALGKPKALWTRKAGDKATAAVTRTAVIISDRGPDRVIVLDPVSGELLKEVRSGANVVASDGKALLLADRRELGYLPFIQ